MNDKLRFILVSAMLVCGGVSALTAQQQAHRICDTIHYEYIRGKIVVPVTMNGVDARYIVDTGGQTATVQDDARAMGVRTAAGAKSVSDLNDTGETYRVATLENVWLSPGYGLERLNTLLIGPSGYFTELGVSGILGGDAFSQTVLTIDSREGIIVINHPYRPLGLKLTDGVAMLSGTTGHSIVEVDFGGVKKPALFDTGAKEMLMISMRDFLELTGKGICVQTAEAFGISGAGLSGLGAAADIRRGYVAQMDFCGKKFTNVGCVTTPMDLSLIGLDILQHGKVVIDYPRKRFYFLPYDTTEGDMGGTPQMWNVGIMPMNGRFEVATVWDSLKDELAVGDQVVNINGHDLTELPMNELLIIDIMNEIEGDTAFITVMKEGEERKVMIRKEK